MRNQRRRRPHAASTRRTRAGAAQAASRARVPHKADGSDRMTASMYIPHAGPQASMAVREATPPVNPGPVPPWLQHPGTEPPNTGIVPPWLQQPELGDPGVPPWAQVPGEPIPPIVVLEPDPAQREASSAATVYVAAPASPPDGQTALLRALQAASIGA